MTSMIFLLFITSLFSCSSKEYTPASTQVVSEVKNLLQNHNHSIGKDALLSRETAIIVGTLRRMDAPETLRFTTYKQAPNKIRTVVKKTNGTTIERGFDGQRGWQQQGKLVQSLAGDELQSIQRAADFFFDINYQTWYTQVYEKGEELYAGRPCNTITVRNKFGDLETIFFDKESGLKIGLSIWKEGQEKQKYWYRYGHYINMDGVQVPLSIEEFDGKIRKVTLIESITWDSEEFPEINHP